MGYQVRLNYMFYFLGSKGPWCTWADSGTYEIKGRRHQRTETELTQEKGGWNNPQREIQNIATSSEVANFPLESQPALNWC